MSRPRADRVERLVECRRDVKPTASSRLSIRCAAPATIFDVPLLAGEHVTEDTGTGFVHTAPGHGTEDFEIWEQNRWRARERASIDTTIPFTVDEAGFFTKDAPASRASAWSTTRASSATPTTP